MPGQPRFPTYRTEERRRELLRLGLSPAIIRLALFDLPHPLFCTRCDDLGVFLPEWRDEKPGGFPVAYLWCVRRYHRLVTGVRFRGWRRLPLISRLGSPGSGLEFILFRPNALNAGYVVVAYSEQGLLASVFSGLIADQEEFTDPIIDSSEDSELSRQHWKSWSREQLQDAAESVGFRHLSTVEAFWRDDGDREDYYDQLYAYTRSIP
jgi:hypothetical protein